jgi:hypothetical protein
MSHPQTHPRLGIPSVGDWPAGDRSEIDRATKKRILRPDELESGGPLTPRRTAGGWFAAPRLGSAGSGGAEMEPGFEKD